MVQTEKENYGSDDTDLKESRDQAIGEGGIIKQGIQEVCTSKLLPQK